MLSSTANNFAKISALILILAGAILIYQRGGMLAWMGLVLGVGFLVKCFRYPSNKDLPLALGSSFVWAAAWPAIFFYVINTWESGEVVEIQITSPLENQTARTWIMDEPGEMLVYYDAPHAAALGLQGQLPITLNREGVVSKIDQYEILLENNASDQDVQQVLKLMSEKYGDRTTATDIFYVFLGRSRDRTGVVIKIPKK